MSNKVSDLEIHRIALKHFFKQVSTFEIRWKKTHLRDFISRACYKDEFLDQHNDGFSRKELKKLLAMGLVAEKTYTDSRGARRAIIVFVDELLPQRDPKKKRIEKIRNFRWRNVSVWVPVTLLVIVLALLFALAPLRRAFGFSNAPLQTDLRIDRKPPGAVGYFDDVAKSTRCYWLVIDGTRPAISCVLR